MNTICLHNEKELLQRVAEGNQASFGTIYEAYHNTLCQFVQKYVKAPDLASDLVQDVFAHIWVKRNELLTVDSFGAYLFTSVRNHTLNFLKKASRENTLKAAILHSYQPAVGNADYHLLAGEYRQFIQDILNTLPPQTRAVFKLCRDEGMSYDEAASHLGISRNAVKKHMVRSLKLFREKLHSDPHSALLLLLFFL